MNPWRRRKLALAKFLRLDLTHAQRRYADFLKASVRDGARWLEVGCGRCLVPDWIMPLAEQRAMVSRCKSLVGIDVDEAIREHPLLTAKVYGLAGSLPYRDESFDLVTANMVVEHVKDGPAFLSDIFRVLKPGGRFIFHTPNYWNYLVLIADRMPDSLKGRIVQWMEERSEEDRFATCYRMNTVKDIRKLAAATGFQVEELRFIGSDGDFRRFGVLSVLECFVLKANASLFGGRFNSNLLCSLRK
jgi:ubiquinone/menaquinone biosynthesis C-methylase UbiE